MSDPDPFQDVPRWPSCACGNPSDLVFKNCEVIDGDVQACTSTYQCLECGDRAMGRQSTWEQRVEVHALRYRRDLPTFQPALLN